MVIDKKGTPKDYHYLMDKNADELPSVEKQKYISNINLAHAESKPPHSLGPSCYQKSKSATLDQNDHNITTYLTPP